MKYNVRLKSKVIKKLETIDEPYYSKLKTAIFNLVSEPRPIGYIKLQNQDSYRIRIGHYRIIYNIYDDILTIEVINLGHRKDIYN